MSVADFAAPFEERRQPALLRAIVLSLGMHLGLVAMLILGVSWQSREPEPVMVELYRPPPAPAPVVEPPKPAPAPAPVEQRIEKPDIALKEPAKPKPPPKAEPKPAPKPAPKVEAKSPAPVRDLEFERRLQEQLAREHASLSSRRQEEEMRQLLARQQADARLDADARAKALAAWTDKIRAKIRGNIPVLPPDLTGNPEAIFDVVLLPSGDVLSVKLRKPSGHRGYDEMVERAILKSSPLPRPDEARLFQRQLELKFRPQDR